MKKKIAVLYSGHQFDYLFGLLTSFNSISEYRFDIIDAVRNPDEKYPDTKDDIRILKFISKVKKSKVSEVLNIFSYYIRLFTYILFSDSEIFHIEWLNYKSARFEELAIPFLIKLRGKPIVYKVHDISTDTLLQKMDGDFKLSLPGTKKYLYSKVDVFIVHNEFTKTILSNYGIDDSKLKTIPHGINNSVTSSGIAKESAREKLGLDEGDKVLLFFGNIAPYKNLESLINMLSSINSKSGPVKLIIAGRFRSGQGEYESKIRALIHENQHMILSKMDYIEASEVELYFKASDALCLPYKFIFQSGVTFLSMRFQIPVIARDVGGLAEDIYENKTGFLYKHDNQLEETVLKFLNSRLFSEEGYVVNEFNRVLDKYSWETIAKSLQNEYKLLS